MENQLSQGGARVQTIQASGSARASNQGRLRATRNCNIRVRPNAAANVVRMAASGESFSVQQIDAKWVQILGVANQFMSTICFR